eukprot:TRINITY_DN183_c0_g1_i3.p1 TRINITY_DN183_c0_g1~~TRINITY_DN183_c0_g1_i3.p1  ORF type:complete len:266 (-),score=72.34 TRINITY_DN183_c0_g1_i3:531-1238(-)
MKAVFALVLLCLVALTTATTFEQFDESPMTSDIESSASSVETMSEEEPIESADDDVLSEEAPVEEATDLESVEDASEAEPEFTEEESVQDDDSAPFPVEKYRNFIPKCYRPLDAHRWWSECSLNCCMAMQIGNQQCKQACSKCSTKCHNVYLKLAKKWTWHKIVQDAHDTVKMLYKKAEKEVEKKKNPWQRSSIWRSFISDADKKVEDADFDQEAEPEFDLSTLSDEDETMPVQE